MALPWLFFFYFGSPLVSIALHATCSRSLASSTPLPLAPAPPPGRPDGLLRPQRSMGGAAQPAGQLLPDLPPGVGQAWRLSAGIAPPPPSLNFPVPLSLCNHFVPNQRDLSTWTSRKLFFIRIPKLVKGSRVTCFHHVFPFLCIGKEERSAVREQCSEMMSL